MNDAPIKTEVAVDSEEGQKLWEMVFSNVTRPTRIIPTISTNGDDGEEYFIFAFGCGEAPNIDHYHMFAIPMTAAPRIISDMQEQLDMYNKAKAN